MDSLSESCTSCPGLRQELHDARRAYHTALDVQRHLAAELDTALAEHRRQTEHDRQQLAAVRDQLAQARAERDALAASLELAHEQLARRSPQLPPDPEPLSPTPPSVPRSPTPPMQCSEPAPELASAEADARRAEAAAEAARAEARELALRLAALQSAGEEAAAAAEEREAEWAHTAALLRAQLHARSTVDSDPQHAEKGNSLFAEVDDKRQEMARALLLMKQKNSQLRRSLAEARAEAAAARRGGGGDLSEHHLQQLTESYAERVSVLEARLEQARRAAARGGSERTRGANVDSSARELAAALQLWELRRERAQSAT